MRLLVESHAMPRRNNRDKRYEPKELDINQLTNGYDNNSSKPRRKRKDKFDKKIYKEDE